MRIMIAVILLFSVLSGCVVYRDYDRSYDHGRRPYHHYQKDDRHDHFDLYDHDRDHR